MECRVFSFLGSKKLWAGNEHTHACTHSHKHQNKHLKKKKKRPNHWNWMHSFNRKQKICHWKDWSFLQFSIFGSSSNWERIRGPGELRHFPLTMEDGLWVSRDGTRARSRVPALGTSCPSCPQHLIPLSLSPFWNSFQKHIPGSFPSSTTISLPLAPLGMLLDLSYLWLWVCFSAPCSDSSPLSTLILSVSSSSPRDVSDPSSEGSLIFCPDWDFLTHMTIHHVLSNSAALGLPPCPPTSSFQLLRPETGCYPRVLPCWYLSLICQQILWTLPWQGFKAEYPHSNYMKIRTPCP